jgi:exonuclease-1
MGIQGLLQGLKFATTPGNIRDFRGQPVCVDGSSWLHKSVYSIAEHYVECIEQGRGNLDRRSIAVASSYITGRCQEILQHAHVKCIYFVMDGKRCPLKAGTNADRDSRRESNLQEARRLKQRGDNDGAFEKYKACIKVTVDLTQEVAKAIQQRFKGGQVQLVWAPYEADPQLVKLCMDGHCKAIITEDSDVLVYCAAVRKIIPVLFKLDRKTGQCQVITMAWLLCPRNNI